MSASKRLMFEWMAEARREDLVETVRDALLAMVIPDSAHLRPLAVCIAGGGGTREQRRAVIEHLLSRCNADAYDAAIALGCVP